MENTDRKDDLILMIKNTDSKRIEAYKKEDLDLYNQLNDRYEYLTNQYFKMIKKQRETEMDIYSEEYLNKMNKGRLNIEKEYGKTN